MSEMALTATHLIVVGKGKLIANTTVDDFIRSASGDLVHVRTPEAARFSEVLTAAGASVVATGLDTLDANGLTAQRIGEAAFAAGVPLFELTPRQVSLEDAFMDITRDAVEYTHGSTPAPRAHADAATHAGGQA
jgi:ABC-2 type transport system ATP-binding protein